MIQIIDMILHIDKYLQVLVGEYSTLTYIIIFLIIFFETGVVVTPFLPGDSLLFAAGALAAIGAFKISLLFLLIFIAAVLGDTLNYHIGKYIGPKVFKKDASSLFFNKAYLIRAHEFYQKYGKKTIILARFIPIIRTFAPFVAGIGSMSYWIFLLYNIVGGLIWTSVFLLGGYLFGNIPWVQANFGVMVIGIIIVSFIPLVIELVKYYIEKKKNVKTE